MKDRVQAAQTASKPQKPNAVAPASASAAEPTAQQPKNRLNPF